MLGLGSLTWNSPLFVYKSLNMSLFDKRFCKFISNILIAHPKSLFIFLSLWPVTQTDALVIFLGECAGNTNLASYILIFLSAIRVTVAVLPIFVLPDIIEQFFQKAGYTELQIQANNSPIMPAFGKSSLFRIHIPKGNCLIHYATFLKLVPITAAFKSGRNFNWEKKFSWA